ncbi:DUF1796 family putative cysteine peptidase [Alteromonas macleodii]|uniref:DUF1796 family putative cysteine peptidase n=1 Tax=Alteromonas macleodii TaxID=28108 RepID=UPI00193091C0|nr:DUF1796 family putative cysteine peptidase [Alteromonas macleodii]|tara:strand:+ start:226 stop:843 length:618 start_codon:yes stop_codon:yes gene_type:complete
MSIGESCQTAYQIRRFFGSDERYIFDWVISCPETIERVLIINNSDDILVPENLEVIGNGVRLLDKKTLIKHQHDFKLNGEHKHQLDSVLNELDKVRSKYTYLLHKTKEYIQNTKPVLVFYDWTGNKGNLKYIERLQRLLSAEFKYSIDMLFVTEAPLDNTKTENENIYCYTIDNSNVVGSSFRWRGCDASWDKIFKDYLGRINNK